MWECHIGISQGDRMKLGKKSHHHPQASRQIMAFANPDSAWPIMGPSATTPNYDRRGQKARHPRYLGISLGMMPTRFRETLQIYCTNQLKIIEDPFVQVVELTLSCTWESLGQLRSVCRNRSKELSRIGALGWRWHSHWAEGLALLAAACAGVIGWFGWFGSIWIYMDPSDLSDLLDHLVTKSGDRKHPQA